MEYLFVVVPEHYAVVLSMLLLVSVLLFFGWYFFAGSDDIHQIFVDCGILLDLVHVGQDQVVLEVAFRSV